MNTITIATGSTNTILAVGLGKYKSRSRRVRSVVAAALNDYGKNASLEEAAATTERTLLLAPWEIDNNVSLIGKKC